MSEDEREGAGPRAQVWAPMAVALTVALVVAGLLLFPLQFLMVKLGVVFSQMLKGRGDGAVLAPTLAVLIGVYAAVVACDLGFRYYRGRPISGMFTGVAALWAIGAVFYARSAGFDAALPYLLATVGMALLPWQVFDKLGGRATP